MNIQLNKPYKIIDHRQKKYDTHYDIPASQSLVVPTINFGDEVSCDVHWENENGELKVLHKKIFVKENLVPLNALADDRLYEIWARHYKSIF